MTRKFLSLTQGQQRQILVVGGGYDTTCLKLVDDAIPDLSCYEVDFPALIDRKAFLFMSQKRILETLFGEEGVPSMGTTTAQAAMSLKTDYGYNMGAKLKLLSADLKDTDTLLKAMDSSDFDFSKPTLLISECVIVYMDQSSVESLCSALAERFKKEADPKAVWVSYDMFNPNDNFGKVMRRNLRDGGITVPGFTDYPTLESQGERFTGQGWQASHSVTMAAAFRDMISAKERQRIGRLEIFDELEEWDMIMSHYCLTLTTIGCQAPHPLSTIRLNASVHLEDDVQGDTAEAKPSSPEASFAFAIK